MTSSDESRSKPRRTWRWLVGLLIVLLAAYSAGWFWMAERVKREAQSTVAALNTNGISAGCANLAVVGFPLAFTVTCDSLAYEDDAHAIAASAGAFYATVTPLWPFDARARLEAPLRTAAPGIPPLWIDWDSLHASIKLSFSTPRDITITAEGLSGLTDPADDSDPVQIFSAANAKAQFQPAGLDLAYRGSFTDLQIDPEILGGRTLPPLAGSGVAKLNNGLALLASKASGIRGKAIEITYLDLSSGDAKVSLSGPIAVDANGLIDANLKISLQNPNTVAAVLASAIPEKARQIRQGFAAIAMFGNEPSIPLKIVKSKATLGFIPLGHIAPLE